MGAAEGNGGRRVSSGLRGMTSLDLGQGDGRRP
jgi:hypothetical protein